MTTTERNHRAPDSDCRERPGGGRSPSQQPSRLRSPAPAGGVLTGSDRDPARHRWRPPDWAPPAVVRWTPPEPPEAAAEWGRRRTVLKVLSLGLAKPKPGREEIAHRQNERLIRSATWPRSVRIAVANPKGGAGRPRRR